MLPSRAQVIERRADVASRRRDPRAAPVFVKRNISAVESCAYYGVADAISRCRVPRSCRDCRAKPGCFINLYGLCADEAEAEEGLSAGTWENDYHRHLSVDQPHGPAFNKTVPELFKGFDSNVFFSSNATYCAVDDEICSQCRSLFQQAAKTKTSQTFPFPTFCVGTDGCVCVASCEVSSLLQTFGAFEKGCEYLQPVPVVDKQLQAFSSVKRDPRSAPNALTHRRGGESCEYYPSQDVRGCRVPRTCADCLEMPGCMISSSRCTCIDWYINTYDYRTATPKDNSTHSYDSAARYQFPSSNSSYCPSTDPVCSACRAKFRADISYEDSFMAAFCVGMDGCVCLEFCESNTWSREVAARMLCGPLEQKPLRENSTYVYSFGAAFVMWGIAFLLLKVFGSGTARLVEEARRGGEVILRHMLDQAPAFVVDPFGWRQFHARLAVKERLLLEGQEDLSPVAFPVDFDFLEPSAPEFGDDDSSAPTATDPRALASAPRYVCHREEEDTLDVDPALPTAPHFEDSIEGES